MKQPVRNTEMISRTRNYNAPGFVKPSHIIIAIIAIFASFHPIKSYAFGDTTAPVLTVNGPDTTVFEVSSPRSHALVPTIISAIDAVDGNLTGSVYIDSSSLNTGAIGIYQISYSVSDLSGNRAVVYRYVDVIDTGNVNPGVKPVMHLIGIQYFTLPRNYAYTDSGAYATDAYFSTAQLQHRISHTTNLDNTVDGNYTYTYTLTDTFGNVANSVTRYITVIDNKTPAVLTLKSSSIVQTCQNSTYSDAGYVMYDPYYFFSDITVVQVGTYSGTSTPGLYYFRYKATDPDGNVSYSDYRYVNVLASNDNACQSSASTHEKDSTICSGSCPTLRAPASGSAYSWSSGATTQTLNICPVGDTVIEVSVTNGSSSASYVYHLSIAQPGFSCVWPGDANADGVADNNDVLAIGIAYGDSGRSVRPNATINWTPQPSYDWWQKFSSGVDYKNADCDGNAFIDSFDIAAIYHNYGYTHHKTSSSSGSPSDPPLSVTFDNDSTQSGDTVTATINLGTASNPVSNVYGLAFSLSYNDLYVKSGKAKANPSVSWLGNPGKNLIYFLYDDSANATIDFAITRTDHKNINGYGQLAKVSIVMQDNLGGKTIVNRKVVLTPSDVNLISFDQKPIPLYATGDSVVVTGPSSIPHISNLIKDIKLYPNPASQVINIDPGNEHIIGIRIINAIGKVVYEQNDPGNGILQIPVSQFNSGIYTIIIDSKNGTVTRQMYKN